MPRERPRPGASRSSTLSASLASRTHSRATLKFFRRRSRELPVKRLTPPVSTSPVAWQCLRRPVSLHPSSFALPPWLRPRSSGHRHMPRQNRLRRAPRSRRKISRRAMGRKVARHFAGPRRVNAAHSSIPNHGSGPHSRGPGPSGRATAPNALRDWNSVPVLIEGKDGGFATSGEFLRHV